MIKEIEDLLNDSIMNTIARCYNSTRDQLKLLGGFESHVFEFTKENKDYILKITHTIRRSKNYLLGELEFVNHLYNKKVNVQKPIKSVNGRFVEEIKAEKGSFLAYAFEKVPGDSINNNEFDGEKLFKWGELLATINLHSKDFEPSDIIYKRMHWLDALKSYFDQFVPENEEDVRDKTYKLMNKIDQIPKTGENFGLTHSDLGHNNIIYHEGNLVAIDFDECDYQYFGYEIAKALYCSIRFLKCLGMEEKEFIKYFKVYFLGGYKSIKSISDSCLKNIPDFLRINNCILYAAACQYFGTENPAERGKVILDF